MKANVIVLILFCILAIIYSIYVIIYEKRSIKSKLIEDAIRLSGYKERNSKEENINNLINKKLFDGEKRYKLPKLPLKTKIIRKTYKEIDYYVFNKNSNNKSIFYLHGGSYFDQPLILHIQFCDKLAKALNCEVILPIYPKIPFHDHLYSQTSVLNLYKHLYSNAKDIILIGDSAGGGFCVSLCYLLNENNIKLPSNTILLSPWLDVSMSNPDISYLEAKDPQLSLKSLKKMGKLWAGKSNIKNYLVSPLYGEISSLKNITLFVGTHELFLPDCRLFNEKCLKNNVKINYLEYDKMDHVFLLQPIPEAKDAFKKIVSIVKNK